MVRLFNIYLSFSSLDPPCPVLLSLGSTPITCFWVLSFTSEGTLSAQNLLHCRLLALTQEPDTCGTAPGLGCTLSLGPPNVPVGICG